ncbi:MAG: NAD(P)-binding domain-containing protein [Promethearchaeota archaeon]
MVTNIYHEKDGDLSFLKGKSIAILGYGNQARAQALNMRDSGLEITIAPQNDEYKQRATHDKFPIQEITEAVKKSEFIFLYTSDDLLCDIFEEKIKPNLNENETLIFYSGYNIAFDKIKIPDNVDIILISPRLPGLGVRENYLNKRGYFSFIGVHQDYSGNAKNNLLALSKAIGALSRAGIEISFKQQAILSLFADQTFACGFIQIMIRSISNLIAEGYPPEAVFVELFLSGEGSYTIDKVIDVGMIKQMNFHSQTSQYGQMSRGIKFRKVANEIGEIQEKIFQEIKNGDFAREWDKDSNKLKLKILRYFASKVNFANIEEKVRDNLGFAKKDIFKEPKYPTENEIKAHPELKQEIDKIKAFYSEI